MNYFTFKNQNSIDMGIVVSKLPDIVRAKKRVKEVEVPGRQGILHEDLGTYENYEKSIECALSNEARIDSICEWLSGYGEAIFSNEPDKIYRVFIKNQIPIGSVINQFPAFLVQFDTYPLKYNVNPFNDFLTLTAPATIYNKGTYYSEPVITIYGTGGVDLAINGISYTIKDIDEYISINSEVQEVYKGDVNNIIANKNDMFIPSPVIDKEFPRFEVGENRISFSGNVTKIEIQPNWRWL